MFLFVSGQLFCTQKHHVKLHPLEVKWNNDVLWDADTHRVNTTLCYQHSPGIPGSPCSPCPPAAPGTPVFPIGPETTGPGSPGSPLGPVGPGCPCKPWGPAGAGTERRGNFFSVSFQFSRNKTIQQYYWLFSTDMYYRCIGTEMYTIVINLHIFKLKTFIFWSGPVSPWSPGKPINPGE